MRPSIAIAIAVLAAAAAVPAATAAAPAGRAERAVTARIKAVYDVPGAKGPKATQITVSCRAAGRSRFRCTWRMRDSLYGDLYSGRARVTVGRSGARAVLYRLACQLDENSLDTLSCAFAEQVVANRILEVYAVAGTKQRPTQVSVTCRPLGYPRFQCAWHMRDALYRDRYSGLARAALSLDVSRAVLYRLRCRANENSSVGGDLSCLLPY